MGLWSGFRYKERNVKRKTAMLGCVAALSGAAVAFLVSAFILDVWINLGWRRPIQDWMTAHGVGWLAGHFGVLYILIPDYTLALTGGIVAGFLLFGRWWQSALLYSGSMFVFPYVMMTLDGSITFFVDHVELSIFLQVALQGAVVMPLALGGAWLASRPKRRRGERLAANRCLNCGYDLRASASGICPECGQPTTTKA